MENKPVTPLPEEPQKPEFELPEPNPVTTGWHRKQTFRMITLPFILALVGFIAVCLLAWSATSDKASLWADISSVFLAILMIFGLLLGIVINAALAYVVFYMNGILPPYTRLLQNYSHKARYYTRSYADKLVEPIIKAQSTSARWRGLRRSVRRGGSSQSKTTR